MIWAVALVVALQLVLLWFVHDIRWRVAANERLLLNVNHLLLSIEHGSHEEVSP